MQTVPPLGRYAVPAESAPAAFTDRSPPYSAEAEISVLGGMLIDADALAKAVEVVDDSMFYPEKHRRLFRAMVRLWERGEAIDAVTLADELRNAGDFEAAGGMQYIATLLDAVPTAANIEYHAKIVREKAVLRRLIEAATGIIQETYANQGDVDLLLDRAESSIFQIAQTHERKGFVWIKELLWPAMEQIELLSQNASAITGVPTGFSDLDVMTAGFQKGDLIIVAARPSMGKTAFTLNIAQHAAISAKKAVAFFSLEMSKESLVQRMLTSEARVDASRVRTGRLRDDDYPRLGVAAGLLNTAPIFVDDTPGISILEMRAKARRLKSDRQDLSMIIVDYLQLMQGNGKSENRQQEVSEISRGLKALAKELEVPVVALSQLSRAVESRPDKRPMMSDLRECVTGDTLVLLADGRRVPIRNLVGQTPTVLSLDERGGIVPVQSEAVWSVGIRPVFRIELSDGRSVRTTAEHRLLGPGGWVHVRELAPGDLLAAARSEKMLLATGQGGERPGDALPPYLTGAAAATAALTPISVDEARYLGFESIVEIRPDGQEEVFDLTVPGTESWLADGIVSHNSGAIEQDADVIMFLFRPEYYYGPTDKEGNSLEGRAEVIIGKQRNGATGTVSLMFLKEFTRFESFTPRADDGPSY